MAGRDTLNQYVMNNVYQPQQTNNPPQPGGFLRPSSANTRRMVVDPVVQDFADRNSAYDVVVSRGRQDLADTDPMFEDVRAYRTTGQLPEMVRNAMGQPAPEQPVEQQQPQQPQLFTRNDQQVAPEQQTQTKPRWDYSKQSFTPMSVNSQEEEDALKSQVKSLSDKWASAVYQAREAKFNGNMGGKGNTKRIESTDKMVPWMLNQLFGVTPDVFNKLAPDTRREMISDVVDLYSQHVSPETLQEFGDIDAFKQSLYDGYGVSEKYDKGSEGSVGTFLRNTVGGAIHEANNIFSIAEGVVGDGDVETGPGQAYKALKAAEDWVREDPNNGNLMAAKQRLMTLLGQDRVWDAVKLVASNRDLMASMGGDVVGAIGADALAAAGVGAATGALFGGAGAVPGAGVGGAAGAIKGTFTVGSKMQKLAEMAKMAKRAAGLGALSTYQTVGNMYQDLLDRGVEITPEVQDVMQSAGWQSFVLGLIPGTLEGSATSIARRLVQEAAAKGKTIPNEVANKTATEIAKVLAARGVSAADGVVAKATPWERIKGGVKGLASYPAKGAGEFAQEASQAYISGATNLINEDGTVREATDAEQNNRISQALFEGAIGLATTVPRTAYNNFREHGETARLKGEYERAYTNEQIEEQVKQQSPEFRTLYEQAEGTPQERFQMAQDTLAAQQQAEAVMQNAAEANTNQQTEYGNVYPDNPNDKLNQLTNEFTEDGADGLVPTHNPLHGYTRNGRPVEKQDVGDYRALMDYLNNRVLGNEENQANAATNQEIRNAMDSIQAATQRIAQGDLADLSSLQGLLNTQGLAVGDGRTQAANKSRVKRLADLSHNDAVVTDADGVDISRFTKQDRDAVAQQLRQIQASDTGIDNNDMTGSITRVRENLMRAEDGAARRKGLEQLNVLERVVRANLPESVRDVSNYYRRQSTQKRFTNPVAADFATESGRVVRDNTVAQVDEVIGNLRKFGLDKDTAKRWRDQFRQTVDTNPEVAMAQLRQNIATIGTGIATSNQNRSRVNTQNNARNQLEFARAVDTVNQLQQAMRVGTTGRVTQVSASNFLLGAQHNTLVGQMSQVGEAMQGLSHMLSGSGVKVPQPHDLARDPFDKLLKLQQELSNPIEFATGGKKVSGQDLVQARAYVNAAIRALIDGQPIPEPSPYIHHAIEQSKAEKGAYVAPTGDMGVLTGSTYQPRQLSETAAGTFLAREKVHADKVAAHFEVVDTEAGQLIFLRTDDVDGKAIADAAQQHQSNGGELDPVMTRVKENIDQAVTTDTLDGGVEGKQSEDIPADVAHATVEEVNAKSVRDLVLGDDDTPTGLIRFLDRALGRNQTLKGANWDTSLVMAIKNLLVERETNLVRPPKVEVRAIRSTDTDVHKAYYEHTADGGTIVINENLTTDANFEAALMHELVHWAVAQGQIEHVMTAGRAAQQFNRALYLGTTDVNLKQFTDAVRQAADLTRGRLGEEDTTASLEQLHNILTGQDESGAVSDLNVSGMGTTDVDSPLFKGKKETRELQKNQIMWEELVNFVIEKDANGELPVINRALGNFAPVTITSRGIIDSVVNAINTRAKTTEGGKHGLFAQGRITYSSGKKQPTIIRYGFKQDNKFVTGEPVAYIDANSNSWNLHYYDATGTPHLEAGLTYSQLSALARGLELWPGRIEKNHVVEKKPQPLMNNLQRFSPPVYKFLSNINRLLGGKDNELVAPVRQFASFFATQQVRQQGITSWFSQIENAIKNVQGEDVRDTLEQRYNEIRQKFQYEISENPVANERNIREVMSDVNKLMRESGYSMEKIDDMLYALEAEGRHTRILRDVPIDPLTGKRRTASDNVTGFLLPNRDNTGNAKDVNGNVINDSDGSKYRATWSLEEQNFAKNLKALYIELNNRTLELEHAAGRMSDHQFNELYGKFYVPLRNDDDGASAYTKLVTGRRTKADSPMTHFQSNMLARLKAAEQSMVMQELQETLAKNPVDGFISFNSTTLAKNAEGKYVQRADGFVSGNTMSFWKDGVKYSAIIDDPVFAKALKAQRDSAQKDDVTLAYMRTVGGLTSLFAKMRTMTPSFFITSVLRDGATTLFNHQAAFRGKSGLNALEHQALAIKTVTYAAKMLPRMMKWKTDLKNADWQYKMYRKYSGIGHSEQFDLETTRESIGRNVFDKRGFLGGAKKVAGDGVGKWKDIMHASDDLMRFATWLKYLEARAGREFTSEAELQSYINNNPEISSLATTGAKNITGNFQNKGMGNQFERTHFVFWNAAMVGINTGLKMMNPRYGMQGIASLSSLAALMFLQGLTAANDDEDGKSKFFRMKGLGDWIGTGGQGDFALSLPQEVRPISHLAVATAGAMTGNLTAGEATKSVLAGFLQGFTPFTPAETDDTLFNIMYAFVPTIAQDGLLRATDQTFYGGKAVPKAYDNAGREITDAPNAIRFRNSDSPWAIEMAHAIYSATDGGVDVTPGAVESVPKQLLGGWYSLYRNFDKAYSESGDAISSLGTALAKGRTSEYNEFKLQEDVTKRFEALRRRFRAGESTEDMLRSQDELPEEYQTVLALQKQMEKDLKAVDDDGDALSTINQRIKQLRLDPTSPQELLELQTRAANIYAQRNYIYGEVMRALDLLGLD